MNQNPARGFPFLVTAARSGATEMTGSESAPRAAISFPELFQSQAPFLWRTLRSLGVPASDADDLCQEVMIIVHRRLPDFDGESVRGWLYGICVRVASDFRRSARVRRQSDTPLVEPTIEPELAVDTEARELEQRLFAVLGELDEDKRAIFVLYELEELTLREIADALAVPLQTVYSRLCAARQHVRQAFLLEQANTTGSKP